MKKIFSLIEWEMSTRSHMSWKMINLNEKLSFSSLYLASFVYSLVRMNNSRSKSLSRLIESDLIDWFEDFFDWSMCEESECSLNEKDLLNRDSLNERDLLKENSSCSLNEIDLESFLSLFKKDAFADKICFSCDAYLKKFLSDW